MKNKFINRFKSERLETISPIIWVHIYFFIHDLQKRLNKSSISVNSLQSVWGLRSSLGTWTDIQTLMSWWVLLSGPEWGSRPSRSPTGRSWRTRERGRSWAAWGSDPAPWWTRSWWWGRGRLRCTPVAGGRGLQCWRAARESERWFPPGQRRGSRGTAVFRSPAFPRGRARRAAASASWHRRLDPTLPLVDRGRNEWNYSRSQALSLDFYFHNYWPNCFSFLF